MSPQPHEGGVHCAGAGCSATNSPRMSGPSDAKEASQRGDVKRWQSHAPRPSSDTDGRTKPNEPSGGDDSTEAKPSSAAATATTAPDTTDSARPSSPRRRLGTSDTPTTAARGQVQSVCRATVAQADGTGTGSPVRSERRSSETGDRKSFGGREPFRKIFG